MDKAEIKGGGGVMRGREDLTKEKKRALIL